MFYYCGTGLPQTLLGVTFRQLTGKKSKRMPGFYVNLISQVYVSLIIVYFPSSKFICNCFLDSGQYTEYKINMAGATAIVCFLVRAKKASINM